MPLLKPGDRVNCRIKSSSIISPYRNYDEIKTFEVVAVDNNGCWLYIPHYYQLKETVIADKYRCKTLQINNKFLNENIVFIQENMISSIKNVLEGQYCVFCGEFYAYAEGNQPDGALICFCCKQNPYR